MRPAVYGAGVTVDLGRHRILDGVDLTVGDGDWVTVVGPNGAGKIDAAAGHRRARAGGRAHRALRHRPRDDVATRAGPPRRRRAAAGPPARRG